MYSFVSLFLTISYCFSVAAGDFSKLDPELEPIQISIMCPNGLYARAHEGKDVVTCTSETVEQDNIFEMQHLEGEDRIALKSRTSFFLTMKDRVNPILISNGLTAGPLQSFQQIVNADATYSFKCANGSYHYMWFMKNTKQLACIGVYIDHLSSFTIKEVKEE